MKPPEVLNLQLSSAIEHEMRTQLETYTERHYDPDIVQHLCHFLVTVAAVLPHIISLLGDYVSNVKSATKHPCLFVLSPELRSITSRDSDGGFLYDQAISANKPLSGTLSGRTHSLN